MTNNFKAAKRLYEAFEDEDPERLLDALTPDFPGPRLRHARASRRHLQRRAEHVA